VIVIGLSTRFLSYCTRLMSAAFLQLKKELEEAAWLSGADAWHTTSRVVMPLVWPSFMGGWLWVFVVALRDATLSLLLFTVTNDTLGVRLWALWFNEGKTAQAAALAVCLATISGLLSISIVRSSLARPQRA
jgi:iron(III) transport system permease protein